jgi:hypothetical protein
VGSAEDQRVRTLRLRGAAHEQRGEGMAGRKGTDGLLGELLYGSRTAAAFSAGMSYDAGWITTGPRPCIDTI